MVIFAYQIIKSFGVHSAPILINHEWEGNFCEQTSPSTNDQST